MSRACFKVVVARARHRVVLSFLALLCQLAFISGRAHAETEPLERIRATMDEGQAQYMKGDYLAAASIFETGYGNHPYSAFLFNAGVCYQKAERPEQALAAFRAYLESDPKAPDKAAVRERIRVLEALLKKGKEESAGEHASAPPPTSAEKGEMKSLVVVETDPPGAPLRVYRRTSEEAAKFDASQASHSGWELASEVTSPAELTLDVGSYHLVVEEYREFNRSETDIEVAPGHVHHFKANLSQGAFLGFLKVSANVVGAIVYVDDDGQKKLAWGKTPHGELISPGKHQLLVEAPGYRPASLEVEIGVGDNKELEVTLQRLPFGVVRLDATTDEVLVSERGKLLGSWKKGEPALELELSSGVHELTVRSKGYKDLVTRVEVPEGRILPVRATMVKKYPRGVAWSQAVIGAAVLGTAIYFGVESDRLASELEAERAAGRLRPSDPRLEQGYWYSIGADGGFALGGTLGLLSLYNFLKDPYPDSELKRGKKLEFEKQPESAAEFGDQEARRARP